MAIFIECLTPNYFQTAHHTYTAAGWPGCAKQHTCVLFATTRSVVRAPTADDLLLLCQSAGPAATMATSHLRSFGEETERWSAYVN